MVGLPRSANFWGPVGPTGPCGPCSELYYDRGPEYGCSDPTAGPGCDCDRYVEYWNLVFTGYNMDENQRLSPLPAQNIDTGMGLERVAALKQGVSSVFLTDLFKPLIELGEEVAGKRFGEDDKVDVALRVLADHSRAMTFLVADGVLPSNEGRGYVLRRVIRRAARFSRSAGMEPPFLRRFAERTIELMGGAYPELVERQDTILRVVHSEEERFNRTLDQGLVLVEEAIAKAKDEGTRVFPGAVAFQLHDTYGFPMEVTREIVEERGLTLDLDRVRGGHGRPAETGPPGPEGWRRLSGRHRAVRPRDRPPDGVQGIRARGPVHGGRERGDPRRRPGAAGSAREPLLRGDGGQTADTGLIESETGKAAVVDVQQHGAGPGHRRPRASTGGSSRARG